VNRKAGYADLARMLGAAAKKIQAGRDRLSTLDSAVGDGDHGTAMFKVAGAITESIAGDQGGDVKLLLKTIGWAAMSTDAGSTSPLFGSLFTGMSEGLTGQPELDSGVLARALEAGVAGLRRNTRAQVGDKTLLDALVPAVEEFSGAAADGAPLDEALARAADAALAGAESTRELKARFGRAKNIGERSIGHLDPGAVSISLFFEGLKEGYSST
jgi:dihydroxyacetone kinase-like protein